MDSESAVGDEAGHPPGSSSAGKFITEEKKGPEEKNAGPEQNKSLKKREVLRKSSLGWDGFPLPPKLVTKKQGVLQQNPVVQI
jgi:hypothetical protein